MEQCLIFHGLPGGELLEVVFAELAPNGVGSLIPRVPVVAFDVLAKGQVIDTHHAKKADEDPCQSGVTRNAPCPSHGFSRGHAIKVQHNEGHRVRAVEGTSKVASFGQQPKHGPHECGHLGGQRVTSLRAEPSRAGRVGRDRSRGLPKKVKDALDVLGQDHEGPNGLELFKGGGSMSPWIVEAIDASTVGKDVKRLDGEGNNSLLKRKKRSR